VTIIALLLSLYKFRVRSPVVKLLMFILLTSVLVDLYINIWAPVGRDINLPQNIYMLFLFIALLIIYDVAWKRRYRIFSVICGCSFSLFFVANILFGQQLDFNSYTVAFGGLLILVHCVLFFYHLLVELPVQRLQLLPMFWFNAAFLTYFGGSLFIFAAYVVEVFRNSLLLYWAIQNILRIVHLIIIIVGLWLDLRNIRLRSSLPSAR
jgi:hypothetical protein